MKILDEIEAVAQQENQPGAAKRTGEGISAKIKMSAEDLKALRANLKGKLATVKEGELPLMTLEPKGPGLFTCPREHIREVVSSLGELQKTSVDPLTTVTTYEVRLPDNTVVKVMERIDPAADWLAHVKSELAPDALARFEVAMSGKSPQEIMDHFHGSIDAATGGSSKALKDTLDIYGVGEIPSGPTRWKYKDDPAHWKPERRALHDELIAKALKQAQAFADAAQRGEPTMYAMRGNTAAGKTRAISGSVPELAGPIAKTKDQPYRSVNPDNFKPDLIKASGGNLTSDQVHWEASMLAKRLEGEVLGLRTSDGKEVGSILIDRRLASIDEVRAYADRAKASGRKFVLIDVDAPLESSLVGVLERVPGDADPLPPFKVVMDGFVDVRGDRSAVIKMFRKDPSLGTYEIFGTRPNGDRVRAATVKDGEVLPLDPELFKEVLADPGQTGNVLAQKRITEEGIQACTSALEGDRATTIGNLLRRYLGWTWKSALDAHSKEPPLLRPKDAP